MFNSTCGRTVDHIQLKRNAKPVIHPPRQVSFTMMDELKDTLDSSVKDEII